MSIADHPPMRTLVCGSRFGARYAEALVADPGTELVGLLGRGSARTRELAARLVVVVLRDMVRSALMVARELLTRRTDDIPSHFLLIPLDVRDANALAALAMILCLTPGTAWGELSLDRSTLLLHVFDLQDEQGMIRMIKDRYEKPLMEIFES